MEAHDKIILQNFEERIKKKMYEQIMEQVDAEWQRRTDLFNTGDREEDMQTVFDHLICICINVLNRDFEWKVPKKPDMRYKSIRFIDKLTKELNMICEDDRIDIREYNEKVFNRLGIKFIRE